MKRKKLAAILMTAVMAMSISACGGTATEATTGENAAESGEVAESGGSVELTVTTTFAGEDSNAQNYKNAVADWEKATGNKVSDTSATSDETFKTRIITDFETGSEPDVLFFFNGADANDFVNAGKVVSIDDIRAEYPDFASNMNDDLIAPSPADGKKYAVPVNG